VGASRVETPAGVDVDRMAAVLAKQVISFLSDTFQRLITVLIDAFKGVRATESPPAESGMRVEHPVPVSAVFGGEFLLQVLSSLQGVFTVVERGPPPWDGLSRFLFTLSHFAVFSCYGFIFVFFLLCYAFLCLPLPFCSH
jgi:hypothetical protein